MAGRGGVARDAAALDGSDPADDIEGADGVVDAHDPAFGDEELAVTV